MKINPKYLLAFIVFLMVEIYIALYVRDAIIRPYIGDILVVILLYTLMRAILHRRVKLLPLYIFIFATIIEVAQYFDIVHILQLQNNKVLSTIIGTSFDIKDMLCYLAGTIIIVIWEKALEK